MRDRTRTPILDAVRAQRGEGRNPYERAPVPVDPVAPHATTQQRTEAERILAAAGACFTLEPST